MDDVSNENGEEIMLLNLVFKASNLHDVVHSLQRIDDMVLVVISVFFEVTLSDLFQKYINVK